jgi:hypothetical protein
MGAYHKNPKPTLRVGRSERIFVNGEKPPL